MEQDKENADVQHQHHQLRANGPPHSALKNVNPMLPLTSHSSALKNKETLAPTPRSIGGAARSGALPASAAAAVAATPLGQRAVSGMMTTPASARYRTTATKAAATDEDGNGGGPPELEAYLRLVGGRTTSGGGCSSSTSGASPDDCDNLRRNPTSADAWWRFLSVEERAAAASAGGRHVPPPPPLMTMSTTATSAERSASLALLRLYETATRTVPRTPSSSSSQQYSLSRLWLGLARRAWQSRCVDDGRDAFKALRSSSRLGARDAHLWAQWALLEAFCCGGGGRAKGASVVEKARAAGAVPVEALDAAAAAIASGDVGESESEGCCWLDPPAANPDLPAVTTKARVPAAAVSSSVAAAPLALPPSLPPVAPTPTATLRGLGRGNGNGNTSSALSVPRRIGGGGTAGSVGPKGSAAKQEQSQERPRQQQLQQQKDTTASLAAAVAAAAAVKFSSPASCRLPSSSGRLQQQKEQNPPSTPVEDAAAKKRKAVAVGDAGVSPAPVVAAAKAPPPRQPSLLGDGARASASNASRPAAEAQKRRSPPMGTKGEEEAKAAATTSTAAAAQKQPKPREDENSVCVRGTRYAKLECVGRGGSSKVFKVMAPTRKIYALKRIRLQGRDREAAKGFVDEIGLLSRLKGCPGIVQLIDAEVLPAEKLIYVVLEYGDIDLAHLLAKASSGSSSTSSDKKNAAVGVKNSNSSSISYKGPDGNFIRLYWQQMLRAVETIHEHRIVHSDLKPANFLVVKGSLKLIDFGIAKAISADTTSIARESQVGTLNYMSPEAVLGGAPCPRMAAALEMEDDEEEEDEEEVEVENGDNKKKKKKKKRPAPTLKVGRPSDVWSLGCILYQMAYGHTPFASLPFVQKLHAITDPAHEIAFPPHPDSLLVDVAKKCLCRDPRRRATIAELLAHPFLCPAGAGGRSAVFQSNAALAPSSGVALTREELAALLAKAAAAGAAGADASRVGDELLRTALGVGGEAATTKAEKKKTKEPAAKANNKDEEKENNKASVADAVPSSSQPPPASADNVSNSLRADLERMKFDDTASGDVNGGGGGGGDDYDDDSDAESMGD